MELYLFRKSSKQLGEPSGTIVCVGDAKTEEIKLELINSDNLLNIEEKSGVGLFLYGYSIKKKWV